MENLEKIKKESESIFLKIAKAADNIPVMTEKAQKATAALSGVKKIESDEDDEKTGKLLVKVRATYDLIKKMRMDITSPLDDFKKKLMEPEKLISNLSGDKDSEYNRVKGLRDKYANDKFLKQKQEAERIEREKNEKEEIIRLSSIVEKSVFEGIVDTVYNLDQSIENYLQDLTLENFDEKLKRLKLTPKLKPEIYEAFFKISYDKNKLSEEKFQAFIKGAKDTLPYEKYNEDYIKSASEVLKSFVDKMPERRAALEELAELQKSNAKAAEKMAAEQKEKAEKERAEKEQKLAEEKKAKQDEIDLDARNKQVEANFDAQVNLQSQTALKNVRTNKHAVINCKQTEIVQVFSKVLFACFSSPNFKGYLKTDKAGNVLPPDENGVPVYEKWADELLKFYAENSDMKIDGIEIKETVSTIQKK